MVSLQSNKAKTKNSGRGINCDGVGMCQAHSSQGLFFIEFGNRVRDRICAGSEQPFSTGSCENILNKCGGSDSKESSRNAGDAGLIPGSGRSLEEEMATHSYILVSKIPWTEEPGGLQSMGMQRVRHD